MNENEIRKYATIMQETGVTYLEITSEKDKIKLKRECTLSPKAIKEEDAKTIEDSSIQSIKSPLVGIFYASSAEDKAPYVSNGSLVKKGQTLCVIEAMKLMNEIPCEQDCTILEVCVKNGQLVEFGTTLFRIKI